MPTHRHQRVIHYYSGDTGRPKKRRVRLREFGE